MSSYHSLFLSSDAPYSQIEGWLNDYFGQQGYQRYFPFESLGGVTYADSIRLFIVPQKSRWRQILLDSPSGDSLSAALSQYGICLSLVLSGKEALFSVYRQGIPVDAAEALESHLMPGKTAQTLRQVLSGQTANFAPTESLNSHYLPDSMQSMLKALNPRQVNQMFQKITRSTLGGEAQKQAQQFLDDFPKWDSEGGQQLRAIMACLIPQSDWYTPDFATLRTAYALHLRRQKSPAAPSYPGDDEALSAVPDALDYVPVYAGK